MIQDIDEINVTLGNDNSIDISIDNDNSISVTEGTPTDISEIMHNEEIRQENEAQRIANEEDREDYINDLKQRVLDGEFNGQDGEPGPQGPQGETGPQGPKGDKGDTGNTGPKGDTGEQGPQGIQGIQGEQGPAGQDGTDGEDGISPTVTMTKQGKVTTLTITDKDGEHTTEIRDGNDGSGTGDMLKATYDTNDNGVVDNAEKVNNHTVETDVPANAVFTDTTYTAGTGIDITNNVISSTQSSAEWGNITGTLSDQTDLNTALSGKQDVIDSTHKLSSDLVDDTGTSNKFVTLNEKVLWNSKSDFSGNYNDLTNKPTIPSKTSDLTNDSNFISTSSTAGLIKNDGTIDTTSYSTFSGSYNDLSNKPSLSTVATSGSYTDLTNKPTIPDELADLSDDSTHRVVTDTEKTTWSGKQDALVSGTNIKTINNTSILGSGNIDVGADIPQQDTAPSNPQEDDLWIDTDEDGYQIAIDNYPSTVSTNPVENQAITNYVNDRILPISTKTDKMTIYREMWNTSITFNMPIGAQALVLTYSSDIFMLWNPADNLSYTRIAGGSNIWFSRASDLLTVTASSNGNATWTVVVFN